MAPIKRNAVALAHKLRVLRRYLRKMLSPFAYKLRVTRHQFRSVRAKELITHVLRGQPPRPVARLSLLRLRVSIYQWRVRYQRFWGMPSPLAWAIIGCANSYGLSRRAPYLPDACSVSAFIDPRLDMSARCPVVSPCTHPHRFGQPEDVSDSLAPFV